MLKLQAIEKNKNQFNISGKKNYSIGFSNYI